MPNLHSHSIPSLPHRFPPWRSLKRCPPHPALELSQPGDTAPRRPADATTTLPGRGGWQGTRRGRKASLGWGLAQKSGDCLEDVWGILTVKIALQFYAIVKT